MKRKYIILGAANCALLLAFAAATLIASRLSVSLKDQQAAARWVSDGARYAQVSIFSGALSSTDLNGIFTARVDVDKKLTEDSIEPLNNGMRVWADCFSAPCGKISVKSDNGSSEAELTVTGGDFFLFHPLELVSGNYYSDSDVMNDRVLIDEVAAWQLYGSSDVAGQPLVIEGKYFFVSGVFRQSDNKYEKKVRGSDPRMFMHYEGYELLGKKAYFSCYEACLPDPVTGRAMQIIKDVFSIDENKTDVFAVENSARYSLRNRFSLLKNKGTRSVVDRAVVFPYWENAARIAEDKSVFLLELQITFLLLPMGTVIYLAVKLYRKRKLLFMKAAEAAKRALGKLKKRTDNINHSRKEMILK